MQKILDFHTHAYPDKVAGKAVQFLNDYYHITCQGDGTLEDLLSSAKEGGVGYLLVHAVATKPGQVENVNSWIGEHIGGNVIGFGTLHPDYDGDMKVEIERIISLGLKGVKLHPDFQEFIVDDPSTDIIYRSIEGRLPLLLHTGDKDTDYSSPYRVENILKKYPRLTVIAAHLGGYSEWEEAEEHLVGKNLYIDTSSSLWAIPPERAVSIIRRHGVDRVLFGTDYPLTRHKEELQRFFALGLTEEENRKILFENAAKLLGLGE